MLRWLKRLKWLRVSKVVIPIALAVSLIFAGFTVYGHEAEFFVINAGFEGDVRLSLSMDRDLSNQTSQLLVPAGGSYDNVTFDTDVMPSLEYDPDKPSINLPNDIAKHDGVHSVYTEDNLVAYYSFSFYLINNSDRAVNVDYSLTIDNMTINANSPCHMDEAVRIMFIEDEPLLTDDTYLIYQKPNKPPEEMTEEEQFYFNSINYDNVLDFESDLCVFSRTGDMGLVDFPAGGVKRFTLVFWLEGNDPECIDDILGERLKLSMTFSGE